MPDLDVQVSSLGQGTIACLQVAEGTTVRELKETLLCRLGIPLREQRLVHGTTVLEDDFNLSDLGVEHVKLVLVHMPQRLAVTGSWDTTLRLWDIEHTEESGTSTLLKAHHARVRCIDVDWNSSRALSGAEDSVLCLWDLESGTCLREFCPPGPRATHGQKVNGRRCGVGIYSITADWDLMLAFSGEGDGIIHVWDLSTGGPVCDLRGYHGLKCFVAGFCRHTLRGHRGPVTYLAADWYEQRALSAGRDGTLRIWALDNGEVVRVLRSFRGAIFCAAVDWNSQRAFSGASWGLVLWDLRRGQILLELDGSKAVGTCCLEVDWATGRALSGGGGHDTLTLWDLNQGKDLKTMHVRHLVSAVAVDWNAGRFFTSTPMCGMKLWDLETGESLLELQGHRSLVSCVACHYAFTKGNAAVLPAAADDEVDDAYAYGTRIYL